MGMTGGVLAPKRAVAAESPPTKVGPKRVLNLPIRRQGCTPSGRQHLAHSAIPPTALSCPQAGGERTLAGAGAGGANDPERTWISRVLCETVTCTLRGYGRSDAQAWSRALRPVECQPAGREPHARHLWRARPLIRRDCLHRGPAWFPAARRLCVSLSAPS